MAWYSNALQNGFAWSPPNRYDYSVPLDVGTPVTSPVDGVILPASRPGDPYEAGYGRTSAGGQVDILSNVPAYNGVVVVDMIHFDTITKQPGAQVKAGEVIGTSGGQLSGGNWPVTDPKLSTGPHIGVAVKSYAPKPTYYDPTPLISDLVRGTLSSQTYASGQQVVGGGTVPSWDNVPVIGGIKQLIDQKDWGAVAINVGKIVAGAVILLVGVVVLFLPVELKAANAAVQVANPALSAASHLASIGASHATTDARKAEAGRTAAETEDIRSKTFARDQRTKRSQQTGDFLTRREPGKRARTVPVGPQGVASPLPARPGSTAGSVSMPTKGTKNTGFPGRNAERRAQSRSRKAANNPTQADRETAAWRLYRSAVERHNGNEFSAEAMRLHSAWDQIATDEQKKAREPGGRKNATQ